MIAELIGRLELTWTSGHLCRRYLLVSGLDVGRAREPRLVPLGLEER
ncbi:MAG TPA: hypothetical protein VNK94_10125 [Gaiellaceae bacterium]|nr:hypothetical protein [Gaiellaceae bacterium]